jgi:hypothetical protein
VSRVVLGVLIGLALGAAGAVIVLRRPAAPQQEESAEQAEVSFVQRDADGQALLKLDAETQGRMGLKLAPLAAAETPVEVKGYGRVLDPAPLAALAAEGASAQAALEASTKEFERLKLLYSQDQNASARALEAARAVMDKDRIALESVQLRLLVGWGSQIASQADLPAFVRSLAAQEAALVRVDVPSDERAQGPPTGVRLAPVSDPERWLEAQYLGPAPATDPQLQTEGVLLLVKGSPLRPGTAVLAWLAVGGPTRPGVIVPRDALLRHEGETFVYLQTAVDVFQRKAVALERPAGDGWFVSEGFKPQDNVVIVGAQQLLSEELKGQGGGE